MLADLAHRQHHAAALDQQRLQESQVIAAVRVPEAVEAGEARGGQRFVDGRVVLDPRVTRGDGAGIFRQLGREGRIDQAGVARAAAVVHQADNRGDPCVAQGRQALVRPFPVGAGNAVRRSALPQDRVADRADTESSKLGYVVEPVSMTVAVHLAVIIVVDAIDCTF